MPQGYNGKALLPGVGPGARSLAALGALANGDPGDDTFSGMRPALRNSLADAWGEKQLSDLHDLEPTVFHRPGSAQVPGFLGAPMDEVYDPENDAPVAAQERSRRQTMLNADQQTDLHTIYDPINATTADRVKDIGFEGDLSRWWEPSNQAKLGKEYEQKYNIAVDPADIAAGGRRDVAGITGNARVDAAVAGKSQPNWAQLFDAVSKTYPMDPRTGERQLPPEMQALRNTVMGFMGKGVGQPGAGGGAPAPAAPLEQRYPGDVGNIQKARAAGYGDAEIEAYLRQLHGG